MKWYPQNVEELNQSINNGTFYKKLLESTEIIPRESDIKGKFYLDFIFPEWFNWLENSTREKIKKLIIENAQKAYNESK